MKRFLTLWERFGWKQAWSFYKDQLEIPNASSVTEITKLRNEVVKKEQKIKNDEAYKTLVKVCVLLIQNASSKGTNIVVDDFLTEPLFGVHRLEPDVFDRINEDLKNKGFRSDIRESYCATEVVISISWSR